MAFATKHTPEERVVALPSTIDELDAYFAAELDACGDEDDPTTADMLKTAALLWTQAFYETLALEAGLAVSDDDDDEGHDDEDHDDEDHDDDDALDAVVDG